MASITIAEQRREQAIGLRRAGRSRREIKEILGISSNETLDKALKGEPPPAWTLRPRAKDELRAKARELREQGLGDHQTAAGLGGARGSVPRCARGPRTSYGRRHGNCASRASRITRSRPNSACPRVPSHSGSATCPAQSG